MHMRAENPGHADQHRSSDHPELRERDMELIQSYLKPEEWKAFRRNY